MLAFAFDVGNGFVKARNEKRKVIAPSVIAKERSVGHSSLNNVAFDTKLNYNTFESQLDDTETYIWGEKIKEAVEPSSLIQTYTHNNRYNTKRFKLLCSFILAELASDFTQEELNDVVLVTGLPSQEIDTKEAEQFKRFLKQKHVVTRNSEQILINVTEVRMNEQPLGTLLNEYMNDEGKMHRELKTSTLTVIDFGAGTTIIDTFKNLKRLEEKSVTFYEGMNDIYKRIAKTLETENNIKGLDISLIEEGFRNGMLIAEISDRKKYAFEDIAQDIITDFIDKRIADIDSALANRDTTDKFILTGGGVNIVGTEFQKEYGEDVIKAKDAQESNVEGFFKLARAVAEQMDRETSKTPRVS